MENPTVYGLIHNKSWKYHSEEDSRWITLTRTTQSGREEKLRICGAFQNETWCNYQATRKDRMNQHCTCKHEKTDVLVASITTLLQDMKFGTHSGTKKNRRPVKSVDENEEKLVEEKEEFVVDSTDYEEETESISIGLDSCLKELNFQEGTETIYDTGSIGTKMSTENTRWWCRVNSKENIIANY
jgi:hypothetical protein